MQYATVESAFMVLYGIAEPGRLGLRARVKRLAQLGVPVAEGPGSGPRRDYTADDLNQLLLALEAEQFDLGPVVAARLIKKYWRSLLRGAFTLIERADADNPVFFWLAPTGISDGLREDDLPKYVGFFLRFDHGRDEFDETILPKLLVTWRPPGAVIGDCPPRLSIINLSLQKRRLDRAVQALEQAGGDKDENRPKGARKRKAPSRKRRAR
jgi:hypothetical protein